MKVSAINYLVDAGPLIGLLDGDDQWHEWSHRTLTLLDEPLGTTETVVAEACHRLRKLRPTLQELLALIAEGHVRLFPVLTEHPQRVGELLAKYHAFASAMARARESQTKRRNGSSPNVVLPQPNPLTRSHVSAARSTTWRLISSLTPTVSRPLPGKF